jgi:S-adenosylmethionine hydrolase
MGELVSTITSALDNPFLLDVAPAEADSHRGEIIQIDYFGNAVTNIPAEHVINGRAACIRVSGRSVGRLRKTYWSVPPGKPLALIGSSGLLEIAIRDGSAAAKLRLKVGDVVETS